VNVVTSEIHFGIVPTLLWISSGDSKTQNPCACRFLVLGTQKGQTGNGLGSIVDVSTLVFFYLTKNGFAEITVWKGTLSW